MNKKAPAFLLIIALMGGSWYFYSKQQLHNPLTKDSSCASLVAYGFPTIVPAQKRDYFLCRKAYAVEFNPSTLTPMWSVEHLMGNVTMGAEERSNDFRADPDLPFWSRSDLVDYLKSGYDRGHMSPAGDFRQDSTEMSQSFYLSNMVPQVGVGNNRDIWDDLEKMVRKWSRTHGELYVITGPIYNHELGLAYIGKHHVAVPTHLYKIILDKQRNSIVSFVMPNAALDSRDLLKYTAPLGLIERSTGIDFFPDMDAALKTQIMEQDFPAWPQ